MALVITPEANIPLPFDTTTEEVRDFVDRARFAVNTIKELQKAGLIVEQTEDDIKKAREAFQTQTVVPTQQTLGTLLHLDTMLSEYDRSLVNSAVRLKHYVTNQLLAESANPDPKIKIKALELLGKIGDVGLFAQKVEVTHSVKPTKEIEAAIMERLSKYENTIDMIPDSVVKTQRLDAELRDVQDAELVVPEEFSITDLENEI
jgi:hypothetical protein